MSLNIFKNGNRRVTKLIILEMAAGVVIMVIGQIMGTLPSQDWLTPKSIQIACFVLGTVQVTVKGLEMFFSKTATLYQQHPESDQSGPATTTTTTTTETKTAPENK